MPLRVLHLSDIHFSTKPGEEKIVHTDVRDQLLNDLRDVMVPRLGNIDKVLIAGDIAFSGKHAEYQEATEWLEEVTSICGCHPKDVLSVPGNHDVDRQRILPATRMIHRRLRTCALPEAKRELVELANQNDGSLTVKMSDYQAFASIYGCQFESLSRPQWSQLIPLQDDLMLKFVGLTTVQVCDDEDQKGAMLLAKELSQSPNKSMLLAAFIEKACASYLPSWLRSMLEEDQGLWEMLLTRANEGPVGNVIIKLVRGGLRRSAIARPPDARRVLGAMSGEGSQLAREHAIRQLLKDYFEFQLDARIVAEWFEEPWVIEVLTKIHADSIRWILTNQLLKSSTSWNSAWKLVEHIPDVVVDQNRNFVQEVIHLLLINHPDQWDTTASKSWQHLLAKVSSGQVQIELCTQALHFAVENRRYPLGGIVAETFYPVHEVAMGHRPKRSLWFSWGFDPWDEAKDLRSSLIDSFLHGNWPPADFVLSAREPWLLRKLCQRMLRQWKGSEFLERAYAGMKKSTSPQARILEPVLQRIIQHPEELKEDWD